MEREFEELSAEEDELAKQEDIFHLLYISRTSLLFDAQAHLV